MKGLQPQKYNLTQTQAHVLQHCANSLCFSPKILNQ